MKKTWLLGFGFLSISLTWALYNAFVPLFLEEFIPNNVALIGFLMTMDNYIALFLQPYIGNLSDKTNTRFGKRMPYLILGMPLAAVFVVLVPLHFNLLTLILFMLALNITMAIFRSPTIALMPDITVESKRTTANGIINFMGGVGSILALAGGAFLYDLHQTIPFWAAAFVLLAALFIVTSSIKENRDAIRYDVSDKQQKIRMKKELNSSTLFILCAIFFWFVAYQGIEALFTLFATNEFGMSDGQASFTLSFFAFSFLLFAIPSGWLGAKFGKKRVIMVGLIGLISIFLSVNFVDSILGLRMLLLIGGMFWACININSYPFIVATGTEIAIGTRTGMYYLVSSLAAIIGPPLMGYFVDLTGYHLLFFMAAICMGLALLSISFVKNAEKMKCSTLIS
jgi:maltose/moltooligosaccharide transporter